MTAALILWIASFGAAGSAVEIPMPGLVGDHDSGLVAPNGARRLRRVTFELPPEIVSVDQFQILLSGSRGNE